MTQDEFTKRTGITPTNEEFEEINAMYMEAGQDIDKDKFCEDYKIHGDSTLLKAYFKRSERLSDKLDKFRLEKRSTVDFLLRKAQEHEDYDMYQQAIKLVGLAAVIKRKLELKLDLWAEDKDYIIDNIQ